MEGLQSKLKTFIYLPFNIELSRHFLTELSVGISVVEIIETFFLAFPTVSNIPYFIMPYSNFNPEILQVQWKNMPSTKKIELCYENHHFA